MKRVAIAILLIALFPLEVIALAFICPLLLAGGYGLVAAIVLAAHGVVYLKWKERQET